MPKYQTRLDACHWTNYYLFSSHFFTHFVGRHIVLVSNHHLTMPGHQAHRGGRIRPHQRDADDDVEILGANLAASAVHSFLLAV
jgi:hypothetical protein